jgi:outer membrane lipase/esterase
MSHSYRLQGAIVAFLSIAVCFATATADARDKQDVVFFGDSLSDTGNRYFDEGVKNTPPYDLVVQDGFVPSFPYAIGGATYSNGAAWVEYLARAIGRGGSSQAALISNGAASNYAYAGARASNQTNPNQNRNFPDQVSQYLADVNYGASAQALHVVLIGGNDLAEAVRALVFDDQTGATSALIIEEAALSFFLNMVNELYTNGGARRFLIATAPDVADIPVFAPLPANVKAAATQFTDLYNQQVLAVAAVLKGLPDTDVHVLDIRSIYDDILANPENYGISDTDHMCIMPNQPPFQCERPDEYVYWDGTHPTARVHEIFGQSAIALMSQ